MGGRIACRWIELNRLTVLTAYWKQAVCVLSTHGPHFVSDLGESRPRRQESSGNCLRAQAVRETFQLTGVSLSQGTVRPDTCDALVTRRAPGRIHDVERCEASLALPGRSESFGGGNRRLGSLRGHRTWYKGGKGGACPMCGVQCSSRGDLSNAMMGTSWTSRCYPISGGVACS
jgi:hypothetical protein